MRYETPNENLAPPLMIRSLSLYRDEGVPLGSFLQAVVEDKLMHSFMKADDDNRANLQHIVAWMYWHMPRGLRGEQGYKNHLKKWADKREAELECEASETTTQEEDETGMHEGDR